MKINAYTYRNNNDFRADYECENCGFIYNAWGSFNLYFNDTIIPNCTCPSCGLNSMQENDYQVKLRTGTLYKLER